MKCKVCGSSARLQGKPFKYRRHMYLQSFCFSCKKLSLFKPETTEELVLLKSKPSQIILINNRKGVTMKQQVKVLPSKATPTKGKVPVKPAPVPAKSPVKGKAVTPPPAPAKGKGKQPAVVPAKKGTSTRTQVVSGYVSVSFPLNIFASYKDEPYKAKMKSSSEIIYDGTVYTSPAAAAGAITGTSVNGYKFWKFTDSSGDVHLLTDIRDPESISRRESTPIDRQKEAVGKPAQVDKWGLPKPTQEIPFVSNLIPGGITKAKGYAAFIVQREFEKSGKVVVYVRDNADLLKLVFTRKASGEYGKPRMDAEGALSEEIISWEDCVPFINNDIAGTKLVRVTIAKP